YYLGIVRKILHSLSELQGAELNIESGEEPGKIIHEYRPEGHERLTDPNYPRGAGDRAWYVYPDNVMRNYDSVDSTPLYLMLMHTYYKATKDEAFIEEHMPQIRAALEWLLTYGDTN